MGTGPGRRIGTPSQYRMAIMKRTKEGREGLGWNLTQMAAELTKLVGRPISADSYRKWETDAMLPYDVILPFCDLTGVHPFVFLGRPSHRSTPPPSPTAHRSKSAAQ